MTTILRDRQAFDERLSLVCFFNRIFFHPVMQISIAPRVPEPEGQTQRIGIFHNLFRN